MVQIDIDMPKNCMCCPFPSVGTDFYYCHCPGVEEKAYDFKQAESIPDDCPLHEADPDTVSRKQAIGGIVKLMPTEDGKYNMWDVFGVLKDLPPSPSRPTIEPERTGQWIAHDLSIKDVPTECCSECCEWSYGWHENYCPKCGAKMEVDA